MNPEVFMKPGYKKQPEPRKEQGPSKSGIAKQQPRPADKPVKQASTEDPGSDIDFNGLPEPEKMAAYLVATQYNGRTDPQKWATYTSQHSPEVDEQLLLKYAQLVYRYMMQVQAMNIEESGIERKWPWWSAARNWNPNNPIWGNRQTWTPSQSILDGVGSRF